MKTSTWDLGNNRFVVFYTILILLPVVLKWSMKQKKHNVIVTTRNCMKKCKELERNWDYAATLCLMFLSIGTPKNPESLKLRSPSIWIFFFFFLSGETNSIAYGCNQLLGMHPSKLWVLNFEQHSKVQTARFNVLQNIIRRWCHLSSPFPGKLEVWWFVKHACLGFTWNISKSHVLLSALTIKSDLQILPLAWLADVIAFLWRVCVFPVQLAHAHLLAAQPDNTCADFDQILSSSQSKSGMSLYGMVAECWNAEQKMTVPAVSGRTYCLRHCNLGEHSEQKRK